MIYFQEIVAGENEETQNDSEGDSSS